MNNMESFLVKKLTLPYQCAPGLPRWLCGKESACQCKRHRRRVWSLGWEDLLEEEMTTPSSILDWRIPWIEEPGGLQSMGSQGVVHDWATEQTLTITTIILKSGCPSQSLKKWLKKKKRGIVSYKWDHNIPDVFIIENFSFLSLNQSLLFTPALNLLRQ